MPVTARVLLEGRALDLALDLRLGVAEPQAPEFWYPKYMRCCGALEPHALRDAEGGATIPSAPALGEPRVPREEGCKGSLQVLKPVLERLTIYLGQPRRLRGAFEARQLGGEFRPGDGMTCRAVALDAPLESPVPDPPARSCMPPEQCALAGVRENAEWTVAMREVPAEPALS
jgi:hypothetical protein